MPHGARRRFDAPRSTDYPEAVRSRPRSVALFVLKLVFSVGMLVFIFRKVLQRDGAEDLLARLSELHWGWVVGAVLMQLIAIGFSTVRWQRLLVGQGIFAPWRFLGGRS